MLTRALTGASGCAVARWVPLGDNGFVPLEHVVIYNLDQLFGGMEIQEVLQRSHRIVGGYALSITQSKIVDWGPS